MRAAVPEHAAIVDALLAGNGAEAARLTVEHLEIGKQRILNPVRP